MAGLGRLWRAQISRRMRELQIVYDAHEPHSEALRSFVGKNYGELKALNPRFPFLCRAIVGREPCITALYDLGQWEERELLGKTEEEIERDLYDLVKIGETHPRGWPTELDLPNNIKSCKNSGSYF